MPDGLLLSTITNSESVLVPWSKQDRFFVGSFHLDAVGLDAGIILQSIMNDAAIKGVEWFQFHDVAPAANFLGGFFGLFDEGIASLGAVATDVNGDLGCRLVVLKQDAVEDVLQVGERLALPSNEAARLFGFHIEQQTVFKLMFFDGRLEAKCFQDVVQRLFWLC